MKDKIIGLLHELNIKYRWVDHPAVFTVAESMKHIEGKTPIKNLLLQEKNHGRKILVIMNGEDRVDMRLVALTLGSKKLQFADSDTLKQTLGVTPGAVSVFGLLFDGSKDVEVVIEERLLEEPELGFHPNENTSTIFIPGSALEQIIKRTDHRYKVVQFRQ